MSSQVDVPERDAHPILHRAFRASRSLVTQWRVAHHMPHTDPRYLDATEEGVLLDLLESAYVRGQASMTAKDAALKDVERNPEAHARVDAKIVESSTTGALASLLASYAKKLHPPKREPARVRVVAGRRPR